MAKASERIREFLGSNLAANLLLAGTCVVVLATVVSRSGPPAASARENVWSQGSAFPISLPVASEISHRWRIVVFVSSRCQYCAAEMPFYQELHRKQGRSGGFQLQFAGVESEDVLRAYVEQHGLAEAEVISVSAVAGLQGTPTIVMLDTDGQVVRSWQGMLSPGQKAELRKLL